MCVLIRVASRCQLTFTTEYIHNVLKTFLPLVTRPCRFDQITRGKIKPRTEGFINHVQMAATLIFTQPRPQGLLAFLSPPYILDQFLTGMRYQPKLLTLSPYFTIIYAMMLLSILSFVGDFVTAINLRHLQCGPRYPSVWFNWWKACRRLR